MSETISIEQLVRKFNQKNGTRFRIENVGVNKAFTDMSAKYGVETILEVISNNSADHYTSILNDTFISLYLKIKQEKAEAVTTTATSQFNENAKYLDVLSKSLIEAIKQTHGNELIDFTKDYIKKEYGITEKRVELVNPIINTKMSEVVHEKFEQVCRYITVNEPVMLVGPAGTGKNVMCKKIANFLGMKYFSANSVQQAYQLTGFIDANGVYQETEFYKAAKAANEGFEVLFVLDEFDSSGPEAVITFNNAMANGEFEFPNGVLTFKDKLHFVACANTFGTGASFQYVGRNQLDAATLDRFATVIIDYSPAIENDITQNTELLNFVRDFRNCTVEAGINHVVSYRSLIRLDKMLSLAGVDVKEVLQECLLKNLEKDDLSMITKKLKACKFTTALKELVSEY